MVRCRFEVGAVGGSLIWGEDILPTMCPETKGKTLKGLNLGTTRSVKEAGETGNMLIGLAFRSISQLIPRVFFYTHYTEDILHTKHTHYI